MGRGWSWETRVKQMERRRTRRLVYRQIDSLAGQKQKTDSVNREETGSDSVKTWILLFSVIFGTIGYLILLIVSGTGVRCILLALVIFVLILRSIR